MSNYDRRVSDAKAGATRAIVNLVKHGSDNKPLCDADAANWAATAVDDLNKAWDDLTDALVRQRDERDEWIAKLLNELAEARKATA